MPELSEPLYVLRQKKSRAVIPTIISLLVLSSIFYLGILLNISLLQLTAQQETILKTGTLIFLLSAIFLGGILSIKTAATPYLFYKDGIRFGKKTLLYQQIQTTALQRNFADKLFKTYSLPLDKKFQIRSIPQETDVKSYVEQMITYSRNQPPTTFSPDMLQ